VPGDAAHKKKAGEVLFCASQSCTQHPHSHTQGDTTQAAVGLKRPLTTALLLGPRKQVPFPASPVLSFLEWSNLSQFFILHAARIQTPTPKQQPPFTTVSPSPSRQSKFPH